MAQHIGIVACSAEGAALCYRTICVDGAGLMGPHAHPEVSLHTHSLADYVTCLDRGDRAGVAELMLSSAHKLARAGADFLICSDNTIHQAMELVLPRSPLPWLHIAEVVAAEAAARGYRKLGITGTRWLVDSDVYPQKIEAEGLAWLRPTDAERDETSRKRAVRCAARDRQRDGHVGSGLGQSNAADGGDEAVRSGELHSGTPLEHAEHHRDARGVKAARDATRLRRGRRCDEGLHFGHERPSTLDRHGDARARCRIAPVAEEQSARIGQADDAVVDELEAADLVGGTEAVLDRAHEP